MLTNDLLARARGGDGDDFRELTEPYRRELQVHCYRMLGSFQDAEDVLQDTLLSAWQGLSGYEERASLRTWLYRIATNRCLNARRAAARRPAAPWDFGAYQPPEPTRLGEVTWLEPYPDTHLGPPVPGPETRYEQSESMSLAFITALQTLPPRQVATLILRDVLGFPATEVATMLDTTTESVTSALKRARATLAHRPPTPEPAPNSPEESALVSRFITAYEAADLPAVIALLTDDVFMSMPPIPLEYEGRTQVATFCTNLFASNRRFRLLPTRANLRPALATYLITPNNPPRATGLITLTLTHKGIRALTRFDTTVLAPFGLPPTIPSTQD
ncbi:RNA polymerase subunit sigma-70 [Catenulispora yoronensis]|uniref:RNA polymerase subunit sigma-70 n=1 Tax=Catenulispora yoronensis TaxID=450799 RepID=UPI0031DBFA33